MKIYKDQDRLVLKGQEFFDPRAIFTCGQAFHWAEEEDGSFTTLHREHLINVKKEGSLLYFSGASLDEFKDFWVPYFDLTTDYEQLRASLPQDALLSPAMEMGKGIRILQQDIFETLISFIISANNNMVRIKRSVFLLSELYGNKVGSFRGRDWYAFPRPEILMSLKPDELRARANVGFRDVRIVEAARRVAEKEYDLEKSMQMETDALSKELKKFAGIGPKVSDCILLFAYNRKEVFPVDTWIKQIMEKQVYKKALANGEIAEKARAYYGPFAGLAQQYLFYARDRAVGS